MDAQLSFVAIAAAMVAAVLAMILPFVWRSRSTTLAVALGLPAAVASMYAVRGDWASMGSERSALTAQWLESGLPDDGAASEQLLVHLEQHLRQQPADARALVMKARLDMRAQRYKQASAAFAKAVSGPSKTANDPGVWVEYAEARGMAQGRTLVGEPLRLVERALALDAHHAQALDLAGSAAWEMHDFAAAAQHWKRLLAQLPPGSVRHDELSKAIQRAQQRAALALPRDSPSR